MASSVSQTLYGKGDGDTILLSKGHPNPKLLPLEALVTALETSRTRSQAATTHMQYGSPYGLAELRKEIARMLREEAGSTTAREENIMVTNGSGQALDMICALMLRRGDLVVVENPTYFLAFYTFRDYGLRVAEIDTDEHGLQVEVLEQRLERDATFRPALMYTVPVCQNPTGVTLPPERMRKLVELSRRYHFKIASDEVYVMLSFAEAPPPSLMAFDDPQQPTVLAMNSFSKILGPGMRLGWIETHPSHIERLVSSGLLLSGGGLNPFTSAIVVELLRSGFQQQHVSRLRLHYAACCHAMCQTLDECLPPEIAADTHYVHPEGGFFLWLRLPSWVDTEQLLELAVAEHGVSFFAGARFTSVPDSQRHTLRLCFAWLDRDRIVAGVRRLGAAIQAYARQHPKAHPTHTPAL